MDGSGRRTHGLQNRLRGAAEASWVGSIPIHPRHFLAHDSQQDSQNDERLWTGADDQGLPMPLAEPERTLVEARAS